MHYYKRNIGDYYKKSGRLTMLQHGSYNLLIDACYDREKFPSLIEAIDWTWAFSDEEIKAVEFVLNKFFTLEEGVYVQSRIKDELANYHKTAETNKRIAQEREAKRAGNATKQKPPVNDAITKRERSVNEAPPNQEPRTINHKPLTNKQDLKHLSTKADPSDVQAVFDCWFSVMRKEPTTKLSTKRQKVISARLSEGYSVEDIKSAIVACHASPWHMGQNDRHTVFNDIELICRTPEKLDGFLQMTKPVESPWFGEHAQATINNLQNWQPPKRGDL